MYAAIKENNLDVVKLMFGCGLYPLDSFVWAISCEKYRIAKWIAKHTTLNMFVPILRNSLLGVKIAVRSGVVPTDLDFRLACHHGHFEIAKYLYRKGARFEDPSDLGGYCEIVNYFTHLAK